MLFQLLHVDGIFLSVTFSSAITCRCLCPSTFGWVDPLYVALKDPYEAIWNVLMPQFVRAPATAVEWEGVSQQFEQMWNVPHYIGKFV